MLIKFLPGLLGCIVVATLDDMLLSSGFLQNDTFKKLTINKQNKLIEKVISVSYLLV